MGRRGKDTVANNAVVSFPGSDTSSPAMGSVFSWLKDPKRRGFGVRMSNQRLTSTCVSALDWGSDLYYFYKVWRWSLGEYFPTANEQLACMMAIGSADGGGACGVAEAGQPCLCNGTTVAYDDVQLVTDSCDVSESLLVLGSLMDTCAAPRAVNASLFVLSVLFGSFVVGLLADVAKFFIVFLNDQGEDLLAAHWALVNATADGQADSPSINDNPAFGARSQQAPLCPCCSSVDTPSSCRTNVLCWCCAPVPQRTLVVR